jgi:hypothetical protein
MAKGGNGGQGNIVTDEYTLCSNFMLRTQPNLCAKINAATGNPQRVVHVEESKRNATGLEKFHAAFDIKRSNLRLAGAENFGVGGEGQGSKSTCDSGEDLRLVWNTEKVPPMPPANPPAITADPRFVYDNRITNSGTKTQVNDHAARCTTRNVYYMPARLGLPEAEGSAHSKVDYTKQVPPEKWAPEFGGSGAVIITW